MIIGIVGTMLLLGLLVGCFFMLRLYKFDVIDPEQKKKKMAKKIDKDIQV